MDFLAAWRTHAEWRDEFLASATRELSRHGDLGSHAHIFRELASGLNRDEVLCLFSQLQQSRRATLEWRDEFLALFPQVSLTNLPPGLYDEEEHLRWSEAQGAAAEQERAEAEAKQNARRGTRPAPDDVPF